MKLQIPAVFVLVVVAIAEAGYTPTVYCHARLSRDRSEKWMWNERNTPSVDETASYFGLLRYHEKMDVDTQEQDDDIPSVDKEKNSPSNSIAQNDSNGWKFTLSEERDELLFSAAEAINVRKEILEADSSTHVYDLDGKLVWAIQVTRDNYEKFYIQHVGGELVPNYLVYKYYTA